MPSVRIWVWKGQAALRVVNLGPGHAEIQVDNGNSYGLWRNQALPPIVASPDNDLDEVSHGYVSVGPPRDFAQMIEYMQTERVEFGRQSQDGEDPPEVTVFVKNVSESQLKGLCDCLDQMREDAPNYCPRAISGTMNCVTFVIKALRQTGILVVDTRSGWPSRLYACLDRLWKQGDIDDREDRYLDNGDWKLRET